MLKAAHAPIRLATPMIARDHFTVYGNNIYYFWKEGVCLSLLLVNSIKDLVFVHLSPFSYKHLLIVLGLVPGSLAVMIVLSGPNSKWSSPTMCRRCDSQWVSLESNVENRHRLVNALTMVSLHISWLQSTAAHSCQVFRNVRDSPGIWCFVPCPSRMYVLSRIYQRDLLFVSNHAIINSLQLLHTQALVILSLVTSILPLLCFVPRLLSPSKLSTTLTFLLN